MEGGRANFEGRGGGKSGGGKGVFSIGRPDKCHISASKCSRKFQLLAKKVSGKVKVKNVYMKNIRA